MGKVFALAAVIAATSSLAMASSILAPAGYGDVTSYMFGNAFNAQPTWGGTAPVGGDSSLNDCWANWEGGNKVSYVDLGADWAQWRIEQTWTEYMQWRAGAAHAYALVWWDANADTSVEGPIESSLNFCSQAHNGLAYEWIKDADVTASPVVPQGRYLMLQQPATPPAGSDIIELAFVGYKVPEPATMSLISLGGLALIRRRR